MPPHPAFFVRRRICQTYGNFELELGSAADYELILRFLLKHRITATCILEALGCMRTWGMSNVSLRNRIRANRIDRRAWSDEDQSKSRRVGLMTRDSGLGTR